RVFPAVHFPLRPPLRSRPCSCSSLAHQVQNVADSHADSAGAEPDELVGMIAPEAVFAQAAEPPRLRQPHDAVQFERRELRKLLLAGLCGFSHRSLYTKSWSADLEDFENPLAGSAGRCTFPQTHLSHGPCSGCRRQRQTQRDEVQLFRGVETRLSA